MSAAHADVRKPVEDLVRRAGSHLLESFERLASGDVTSKGSSIDLVTRLDLESQEILVEGLTRAFPGEPVVAEEGAAARRAQPGRVWLVDPLDGTTNFVHGLPLFAVSVAAVVDGVLSAGAVHAPYLRELFWAEAGRGAHLGSRRLAVSRCADLDRALLATGFPYDIRTNPHNNLSEWSHMATRCRGLRRCGAAALDLAWVAAGRFDAFWEYRLGPWDLAAGALMVREAGGVLSAADGSSEFLWSGDLVAGNAVLHARVLQELRRFARRREADRVE